MKRPPSLDPHRVRAQPGPWPGTAVKGTGDRFRDNLRHQEVRHPRRARHPHHRLLQGLPAGLLALSQPGEPVVRAGAHGAVRPLHALRRLPRSMRSGRHIAEREVGARRPVSLRPVWSVRRRVPGGCDRGRGQGSHGRRRDGGDREGRRLLR